MEGNTRPFKHQDYPGVLWESSTEEGRQGDEEGFKEAQITLSYPYFVLVVRGSNLEKEAEH